MQLTRILSASLAGFLIAGWAFAFGFSENDSRAFGGVYIAASSSYIVALAATYLLRVPESGRVRRTEEPWVTSFMTGFNYSLRHPVILGIFILWIGQSAFGTPYLQVFVPWIGLKVMHIGAGGVGLLLAFSAMGSLVGAIAVATVGDRLRHRGLIVVGGLLLKGLFMAVLGLSSLLPLVVVLGMKLPVLPLLMIVLVGLGQAAITALKNVLLMEAAPNELRGRVLSIMQLDRGFATAGSGVGGFVIAMIGGPYALALFGALLGLCSLLVAALSPSFRRVD